MMIVRNQKSKNRNKYQVMKKKNVSRKEGVEGTSNQKGSGSVKTTGLLKSLVKSMWIRGIIYRLRKRRRRSLLSRKNQKTKRFHIKQKNKRKSIQLNSQQK